MRHSSTNSQLSPAGHPRRPGQPLPINGQPLKNIHRIPIRSAPRHPVPVTALPPSCLSRTPTTDSGCCSTFAGNTRASGPKQPLVSPHGAFPAQRPGHRPSPYHPRPVTTDASLAETRPASYDAVAAEHRLGTCGLDDRPLDQARCSLLPFAELVRAGGNGPVADLGCGSGEGDKIPQLLYEMGLDVFGIDLSPGMVSLARRNYPQLRLKKDRSWIWDLPTAGLGGLLAYYSIIHMAQERHRVFAEFSPGARPAS